MNSSIRQQGLYDQKHVESHHDGERQDRVDVQVDDVPERPEVKRGRVLSALVVGIVVEIGDLDLGAIGAVAADPFGGVAPFGRLVVAVEYENVGVESEEDDDDEQRPEVRGFGRGEGQTRDERAGHGDDAHVAIDAHPAEKVGAALLAKVLHEDGETTDDDVQRLESEAVNGRQVVVEVPFEERENVGD